MIKTDIAIIGAGPCGLFSVFEAGLAGLRCHLIDYLPQPGGQLAEIYPKKPIYDIPGYPSVLAGELVDKLMEQAAPFKPGFTLGERCDEIVKENGQFILSSNEGTKIQAPVVAIAGGLGCFAPRKPRIENIADYERIGVDYIIKDPEIYRNKDVIISGGGDSALDWSIFLVDVAKSVTLVHRTSAFRAAPDSVNKAMALAKEGKMTFLEGTEVIGLQGNGRLESVTLKTGEKEATLSVNNWIPLFGLSPKLGPIANWGLNINKNAIEVDPSDYSTNVEGIYAIGDINDYSGKLKLILCGFHEATMMVHSAYKLIHPEKRLSVKYTTIQGVKGFDN